MPDYASIVKINGVEMPTPSNFDPLYKDYDSKSAGRSEDVTMTRDVIRSDVRQVTFTWKVQTPDLRKIRQAIKPLSLELTFFDINQDADTQYSTMTCYAEPSRNPKLVQWDPFDPEQSWWEFTVTFTEY
ncbi:MAG: hypothetical protein J6A19_15420 [Oscillospiraceae bacterium]|nr:hypothetical protein [Oscillospiraceae bacterium]